jgi:hypothetical protein
MGAEPHFLRVELGDRGAPEGHGLPCWYAEFALVLCLPNWSQSAHVAPRRIEGQYGPCSNPAVWAGSLAGAALPHDLPLVPTRGARVSLSESRRVDPEPIVRLRAQVQALVTAHGFSLLGPDSKWTGKYNMVAWVRRSWKEDQIRLGWRKTPTTSYFLDAQWAIPRADATLVASGISPGYMRRGLRFGEFPVRLPLVGAIAERRWRDQIIRDAEFAVGWLDGCSSLAGALSDLERPERNGPGSKSEAYAYIERYVRKHATP